MSVAHQYLGRKVLNNYSSRRPPIASSKSLGTGCLSMVGGGRGGVGDDEIVHIITIASACRPELDWW